MPKPLLILGTSGLAREMAQLASVIDPLGERWQFMGFVSDRATEAGTRIGRSVVVGHDAWLLQADVKADLVVGIGYPRIRASVLAPYLARPDRFSFPNLVHPSAVLDSVSVQLGRGNVVAAGAIFTCDIEAGDFNLFNYGVTIGHDDRIGSYDVINPGANIGGWVQIGDRCLVGAGSQVLERLTVGSDAIVGAGAVVTRSVESGLTVVGVPARPMQGPPEGPGRASTDS